MTVTYWRRICLRCECVIDALTNAPGTCALCGGECTDPAPVIVEYKAKGPVPTHRWYDAPENCRCEWCREVRIPAVFRESIEWGLHNLGEGPSWAWKQD